MRKKGRHTLCKNTINTSGVYCSLIWSLFFSLQTPTSKFRCSTQSDNNWQKVRPASDDPCSIQNLMRPLFSKLSNSIYPALVLCFLKKMRRKEIVGWFSIGRDNTGEEELIHWREMLEAKGRPVRKWHVLSAVSRSFDEGL